MFSSGRTSRRRGRSDERPSEASAAAAPRIGESANCNENPHVCGKEAACRSLDSETSRCVCPHDLSPPTRDLKCPNRLLAPLTPRPIYNIIVPPNGNGTNTTNATNATTTLPDLVEQVAADRTIEGRASKSLTVAISGLALLTFLTLLVYLRRARWTSGGGGGGGGSGSDKTAESRHSAITSPRSLKTEPPLANGYTPNLHYSNCSPPPEVPLLPRHEVQFLRDIGEGCFGKVFKGEIRGSEPTTKNWVAVKVLKDTASREAEEDFMREVEIMSTFRHENILSLMGVVPRDSEGGPWMIFEYMAYGDLARVLRANGKCDFAPSAPPLSLTKSCLEWTTLQIAAGMDYLSSQRFVHRDLACRNCLVGANLVVKIADFGMSRDVYTCDYYKIGGSRLLPVRWMSPESLVYGRFTLESDVWSFGVVLWEIYSWGKQPYYGRNNEQVVKLIVEGSTLAPPDDCPLFVEKLMHDCWRSEPRDRLRFVEILERLELLYRRSEKPPRKSLPRPPQAPVTVRSRDVLDTEGYLLPAPTLPIEYLQTLAD